MPPSEGHSRAPKAPRSRARRRAQELAQEQPAAQHAAEAHSTADAQSLADGASEQKSHGSESHPSESRAGTASAAGRRPVGATIRPSSPARAESVALVDGAIRRVPAATSGSQELFDVEAFEDSPGEVSSTADTEKSSGRPAKTENAEAAVGRGAVRSPLHPRI